MINNQDSMQYHVKKKKSDFFKAAFNVLNNLFLF
jgi:hypothetical protein